MIVADSGPLIAFARIGRLDLLRQVVEALMIPDAVYAELRAGGATGLERLRRNRESGSTAGQ